MRKNHLFSNDWIQRKHPEDSWAKGVLEDIDNYGSIYLSSLSKWFEAFPGSNKQKSSLKAGLLSSDNCSHLGAVNELSWWIFITSRDLSLASIPRLVGYSTPDFILNNNEDNIIFEVTTLNLSDDTRCRNLQYSQNNSLRRIVNKAMGEKLQQFMYGSEKNMPVVLVLFNYDESTGFGTQFSQKLNNDITRYSLPKELSAILYIERSVIKGKSLYKKESFLIYRNPQADLRLKSGLIESLIDSDNDWLSCENPSM